MKIQISDDPFKLNLSQLLQGVILLILILNSFFIFRVYNLYWWSMYLGGFVFIIFWILIIIAKKKITTYLKGEVILTLLFILAAIIGTLLNGADLLGSITVVYLRLIPLLFLGFTIHIALTYKRNNFKYFRPLLLALLLISIAIGGFQYFVLGLDIDLLTSIQGSAHSFSFLVLMISLFMLMTSKKYKFIYFGILLFAVFLSIKADFKLGLIAFTVSYLTSYIFFLSPKKRLLFAMILLLVSVLLLFNLDFILSRFMPGTIIFYVYEALMSDQVWNLDTVYPPNLELFKGYIQLFSRVFKDLDQFIFGLGPGNYASNVALAKNKAYAVEYVIYYRDILNSKGVILGTLLNRFNSMINLVAEFGILGSLIYIIILIRLLFFVPINFCLAQIRAASSEVKHIFRFNVIVALLILIEFPLFGTVEEGLYIGTMCLSIFSSIRLIDRFIDNSDIKKI